MRRNSLANANGFANEMAKILFSLRKFLANGRLRRNSLAIANAMAWCTQFRRFGVRLISNKSLNIALLLVRLLVSFCFLPHACPCVFAGSCLFPGCLAVRQGQKNPSLLCFFFCSVVSFRACGRLGLENCLRFLVSSKLEAPKLGGRSSLLIKGVAHQKHCKQGNVDTPDAPP